MTTRRRRYNSAFFLGSNVLNAANILHGMARLPRWLGSVSISPIYELQIVSMGLGALIELDVVSS